MATMQVVYRFVQSNTHTPPLSRNTPYLLDSCHGNILVAMVTMAAMRIVYKLFVQSDAHIHQHCQETYNNISITSV